MKLSSDIGSVVKKKDLRRSYTSIDLVHKFPLKNKGIIIYTKDNWIDSEQQTG